MKTIDEIFGKHFNGLHYDDITKEGMIKFAEDYATIYHESEVKKLNIFSVSQQRELLKVLEYTRQIKGNPKEIQLLVDKMYLENL